MTSNQWKDGFLCLHCSEKAFSSISWSEAALESSICYSAIIHFFWIGWLTRSFSPASLRLFLEVSDSLKISEPLICLFIVIENFLNTANTMKNSKKKMKRLLQIPLRSLVPITNTCIHKNPHPPVSELFLPEVSIWLYRCSLHSLRFSKVCLLSSFLWIVVYFFNFLFVLSSFLCSLYLFRI